MAFFRTNPRSCVKHWNSPTRCLLRKLRNFPPVCPVAMPRLHWSRMATTTGERFERVVSIMARLRGEGGCPWDREQTFDSIKPYTIEETYEVLEAIDKRDWDELPGELGDLLLQVLFYAQMAKEQNSFSIDEVI